MKSGALALFFILALTSVAFAAAESPPENIQYTVSLAHPEQHLVHVTLIIPPGAKRRDVQLPVWNALYQVRDFSQYLNWIRARSTSGSPLEIGSVDKSRWRVDGAEQGAILEYEIAANTAGPYGAQLNSEHAFFNLAEILIYPVDERAAPATIRFIDFASNWRIATALPEAPGGGFAAENYDRLVDSPVEIGTFNERDFEEGGAHYRVVVDADPKDYDLNKMVSEIRRIVSAETAWMNDRPFESYLFLYHFPHGPGGGGMEHAYSTAIDVNAQVAANTALAVDDVTAHEFFHLWNVKRIRPQSLEPVDYTRENYTDALWFSEGVTDTVQNYVLLRAGFLDERLFLDRLADGIEELERSPAHRWQSAEASSLDAWLEKYPAYQLPTRSISYYNKGNLLGVLLDLAMRDASQGAVSLRDLLQWMNVNYARQRRFFADSDGVRKAAETVSQGNFASFFEKYVAGTDEIPWNDFFVTVGLRVVQRTETVADLGFVATRNFDEPPRVSWVDGNSAAARAGLAVGDSLLQIDGHVASSDFRQRLSQVAAGAELHLRVRGQNGERELAWKLSGRKETELSLVDVDNMTPGQAARRKAWLSSEDEALTGAKR